MKPILLIPTFLAGAVVAIAAAPSAQFNASPAVANVEVPTVEQVAPVKFAEPKGTGGIVSMADQIPNPGQGQETLKPKSQTATAHSDAGLAGKALAEKHGIQSVTTERVVLPQTPASIEGGYVRTQTVFNVYNDGSKATNPLLAGGAEYGWGDVEILSQILHYSQEKKAMEQR